MNGAWYVIEGMGLRDIAPFTTLPRYQRVTVAESVELCTYRHTVAELAAREAPSLLAMATHGRGGFEALWSASVGSRVIGRVSGPLLLVRPAENH